MRRGGSDSRSSSFAGSDTVARPCRACTGFRARARRTYLSGSAVVNAAQTQAHRTRDAHDVFASRHSASRQPSVRVQLQDRPASGCCVEIARHVAGSMGARRPSGQGTTPRGRRHRLLRIGDGAVRPVACGGGRLAALASPGDLRISWCLRLLARGAGLDALADPARPGRSRGHRESGRRRARVARIQTKIVEATSALNVRGIEMAKGYAPSFPRQIRTVPVGALIIHNRSGRHRDEMSGQNGFRVWFDDPHENYIRCLCGWRPDLGIHYRVRKRYRGRTR
jgi:hypothetical protein